MSGRARPEERGRRQGAVGPVESETHHERDDRAVTTVPLDTDDGGTVVIAQQNAGPGNQVGGGEFKNDRGRTVEEAGRDQRRLQQAAPARIDPRELPRDTSLDDAAALADGDDPDGERGHLDDVRFVDNDENPGPECFDD